MLTPNKPSPSYTLLDGRIETSVQVTLSLWKKMDAFRGNSDLEYAKEFSDERVSVDPKTVCFPCILIHNLI